LRVPVNCLLFHFFRIKKTPHIPTHAHARNVARKGEGARRETAKREERIKKKNKKEDKNKPDKNKAGYTA